MQSVSPAQGDAPPPISNPIDTPSKFNITYFKTSNVPPTLVFLFSCISFVVCFVVICLYALILVGVLQYFDAIPWWGVLVVILLTLLIAAAPCIVGLIIYEVFRRIQK